MYCCKGKCNITCKCEIVYGKQNHCLLLYFYDYNITSKKMRNLS